MFFSSNDIYPWVIDRSICSDIYRIHPWYLPFSLVLISFSFDYRLPYPHWRHKRYEIYRFEVWSIRQLKAIDRLANSPTKTFFLRLSQITTNRNKNDEASMFFHWSLIKNYDSLWQTDASFPPIIHQSSSYPTKKKNTHAHIDSC